MKVTILFSALLLIAASINYSQKEFDEYFTKWPERQSPLEIGNRVAERFIESKHFNYGLPFAPPYIYYPEVCTWYGALQFAEASKNKNIKQKLIDSFEPIFESEKHLIPVPNHVDNTVFGAVPLELFIQTKEKKYYDLGISIADAQWMLPDSLLNDQKSSEYYKQGLTWQKRMWIDDMFMITAVQSQAYRATGNINYIDRAAKEMIVYLDSLQKPNGLFYHAPDVPFFWGRGNGWMAAGMSILLKELPKDHPDRNKILAGFQKMMATLLEFQDENGMWPQLIDKPDISWPETSCTAMFTFAFINGVKNGMLNYDTYARAARKGWLGLMQYIDENADVGEVCEGTNKRNDLQYYIDRKRITGDMHGQAPILWCAAALLQ